MGEGVLIKVRTYTNLYRNGAPFVYLVQALDLFNT